MEKNKDTITAEKLDRCFDDEEDIAAHLDWKTASRLGLEQNRLNIDLPAWMLHSLDREVERAGVSRQSVVKLWLAERLKTERTAPQQPRPGI